MQLAVARVADGDDAEHVPFQQHGKTLQVALPGDRPSQIGFFIGQAGKKNLAATARIGTYPGEPLLTTQKIGSMREVLLNLQGIKNTELDEARWADQIGLFDELGFDPARSRGLFSKAHNRLGDNTWTEQRIVVLPKTMDDLLETVGPNVRGDTYQITGYEVQPYRPPLLPRPSYRQDYDTHSFGPSRSGVPKDMNAGLTTGFGNAFDTAAQLGSISATSLQTAFEFNFVPEQA